MLCWMLLVGRMSIVHRASFEQAISLQVFPQRINFFAKMRICFSLRLCEF